MVDLYSLSLSLCKGWETKKKKKITVCREFFHQDDKDGREE